GHSGHVFASESPTLELTLDGRPDEPWFVRHVQMDGVAAIPEQRQLLPDGRVILDFPAAPPGTAVTVTVSGIVSPAGDTLVITLCRTAPPEVTIEVDRDGKWT